MSLRFKYILLLILFVLPGSIEDACSQESVQEATENIVNDAKREEIQRYFGYELLLYRYLSLPYDVSINVNQQGNFVDIGILYLLFIPVLIILLLRRRIWIQILAIVYLFFTWIISTSNSFVFSPALGKINSDPSSLNSYLDTTNASSEFVAYFVAKLYSFSHFLYQPLAKLGNSISGNSDYISYPIIFTGFVLVSLAIAKFLENKNVKTKSFIAFLWVYSFYWFAFSGGIVWYGYITLLLGLFLIPVLIRFLEGQDRIAANIIHKAFIICGLIWIFAAVAYRTSDVNPWIDRKFFGKGIFNPVYYDYATGKTNKTKSLDAIYADISKAFTRINQDKEAIVLRIGTSFGYFINNNHKRVVIDNQLGLFHELNKRYPDRNILTQVLKASGIKYIMLDLNTATIDNTPDQSLTLKYREILIYVVNNPSLRLLATDRVVGTKDQNGQMIYSRQMLGETVYQNGRYAIFEII